MDDLEEPVIAVKLTKDYLKKLNFSRATLWSNFLNDMTSRAITENMDDVLDMEKLDNIYSSADEERADDTTDENNMDGNGDSDLDVSVIEQNVKGTNAQNVLDVIAQNPNTTGIFNEDREFLEVALPFFEDFKRELRENGVDKVLCTFDEGQVEKKAKQMGLSTKQNNVSPDYERRYYEGSSFYTHKHFCADLDTDSDSIDTARYIRLSKKECKTRKRHATKTTTIKSFRMDQSKRHQLHQKYCSLMSDEQTNDFYHNYNRHQCSALSCCPSLARLQAVRSFDERCVTHKSHNHKKYHYQLDYNCSICSHTRYHENNLLHATEGFCANEIDSQSSYCLSSHCTASGHYGARPYENQLKQNYCYMNDYHFYNHCRINNLPLKHNRNHNQSEMAKIDKSCDKKSYLMNSTADDDGSPQSLENNGQATNKQEVKNDEVRSVKKTQILSKTESSTNLVKDKEEVNSLFDKTAVLEKNSSVKSRDSKPEQVKNKRSKFSKSQKKSKSKKYTDSKSLQQAKNKANFEVELQLAIQASKDSYATECQIRENENAEKIADYLKNHIKNVSNNNEKQTKNSKIICIPKKRGNKKKRFASTVVISSSESEFEETAEVLRHKSNKKIQFMAKCREVYCTNLLKTVERNEADSQLPTKDSSKYAVVEDAKSEQNVVSSSSEQVTSKHSVERGSQITSKQINSNISRFILYAPHNTTHIPDSSFVNHMYRLTLEQLGSIIGKKYAQVFFRYYKGKRDFKLTSTVYYVPPERGYYSGNDTCDSDIDLFDVPDIGRVIEECN